LPSSEPPEPTDSNGRFKMLVQGVRDYAIFMLDPIGYVASWNLGAARIKGYSASEIVGKHFSVFYPQEAIDRGWPEHELAVARDVGTFEDEGWRVRKDGGLFWANVVITALRDEADRLLGFSKITRDLTERRAHEEALRMSEERFRLLVDSVRDYAIFMLDPNGVIVSWNAGARRIKGYSASEIVGKHFSTFYLQEALDRGWPEHELAVARREGRFEDEGWRIRKDGTKLWTNVVITAIHDSTGTLCGFAKVTRDLTERRRVERLEEEGRRTKEFLAMLGHELRNPLAPIHNAVTLLRLVGSTEPAVNRAHEIIERQARHLGRIVDDLLDLGRISTGNISVIREPLDLGALVSTTVTTLRSVFDDKRQQLLSVVPDAPVQILGDATRLSQVVVNLLTNANRYTPAGGHIELGLEIDGKYAQLVVRDDGVGLAPELLPRVFEPFVQGARSLDRADGGLGIGLALVRNLVSLHGGTVSASSHGEGRGSAFVVRLPLAVTEAPVRSEPSAPSPAAARRRVLVVDDNEDSAWSIAMLLETWGHEAHTAGDGPSALQRVAELEPDLVLLDIGLPGMDGYEVAERLRDVPCVVAAMTGYGQPEDDARSRAAGFVEHLVKPVDIDRLEKLLARVPSRP
jgi:PAS domain S-box-containing protein